MVYYGNKCHIKVEENVTRITSALISNKTAYAYGKNDLILFNWKTKPTENRPLKDYKILVCAKKNPEWTYEQPILNLKHAYNDFNAFVISANVMMKTPLLQTRNLRFQGGYW